MSELVTYICIQLHFLEIRLYTCTYKIPGYCYTQHSHHNRVFPSNTHLCLRQQNEYNQNMKVILTCSGCTNFRLYANVSSCQIKILTCTVCLISQISFLAPAGVRSNGVIACGITFTAMFTRQALVYVYKRKEKAVFFI